MGLSRKYTRAFIEELCSWGRVPSTEELDKLIEMTSASVGSVPMPMLGGDPTMKKRMKVVKKSVRERFMR